MSVARRDGFILPMVLVVVGLLALTMGGFIFFVRAETAGMAAYGHAQQARLAAESGLETVIAVLRVEPHNARAWFDAPGLFRHALVWSSEYTREADPVRKSGSRQALFQEAAARVPAWRFSVVADRVLEPSGLENQTLRFGVTPESGKLNLNTASEDEIRALLRPLLLDLQVENADELIAALLDWRDPGVEPRPGGAKDEYYNALKPPYNCKGGPFDSVEELLLVKGFNAAILYGEDTNRNGILDPNEDDGEVSEPRYDNQDGKLDRGLASFLTVWSREPDTALSNKPRINLHQNAAVIQAQVATAFTEDELALCQPAIDFILQLKQQNFDFRDIRSVAELYRGPAAGEGGGGGGPLAASPVTLEQLPYLMDRFSVVPPNEVAQGLRGLINVNTAPARVLMAVPGVTPDLAQLLVETRAQLPAEALRTPAWPLTFGATDAATFYLMAPYLTTKAYQYHVEVLGYADHNQAVVRIEWIIDMIGPLAQVRYRRDLTALGLGWPIDNEEVAGKGVEVSVGGP